MVDDLRPPWRRQFDNARDPYTARNVLGLTSTGGGGAPTSAEYLVAADDPALSNDRVLTDTASITWDFTTPGQAKANAAASGGNVSNSGTPTLGQYAKWLTSTTIQGVAPATVLSDIGAQPAGSYLTTAAAALAYQPLDADLTAIAALAGTNTIYYRSAADTWSPVVVSTGLAFSGGNLTATGGGGTPGGANTQVQFNNSSAFGGSANFVWNNTTSVLTVTGQITVAVGNAMSIVAAGAITATNYVCPGTIANLAPALSGNVVLRPSGPSNTTGQVQITAANVIMNNPVTLPAAPTADLHAATKKYVDDAITAVSGATAPSNIPQGRLTLQTATPVMITTQAAKTTIFYTPYNGMLVPIYNGTIFTMTSIGAELSQLTTDTTKSPAAVAANSNYDKFVWSDAGTMRCTRGPAWTSATVRSAGTALVMVNGILVNAVSITNGPAAQRGTYVGTVRSNAASQIDWTYGTVAVGGGAGVFGVWNAYNRRLVASMSGNSTDTWTYASTTVRAANGSATLRHSFVCGLAEDAFEADYGTMTDNTGEIGIGYDVTNAFSGRQGVSYITVGNMVSGSYATTALGFHFFQACEAAAGSANFYGDNAVAAREQFGLVFRGWM